jgi:hypothetical protein
MVQRGKSVFLHQTTLFFLPFLLFLYAVPALFQGGNSHIVSLSPGVETGN